MGRRINPVGVAVDRFDTVAGVVDPDIAARRVDPDATRAKATGEDVAGIVDKDIVVFGADDDAVGTRGVQPAEHGEIAAAGDGRITGTALDHVDRSRAGSIGRVADVDSGVVCNADRAGSASVIVGIDTMSAAPGGGDRTGVDDVDAANGGKGANAETIDAIGAECPAVAQPGIAGAAFGEQAEGVHADGLDSRRVHQGGVAIDRAGVDAGVVADASGRQGIVGNGIAGGQRIVVVDQDADPGTHTDAGCSAAGGLGPDAVAAEQCYLTTAVVGNVDPAAATGIHIDPVMFIANHAVEDVQRGARSDGERRQPAAGIGDGHCVECAATHVDRVGTAIDAQGRIAGRSDYVREHRVCSRRWRAIDRGAAEGNG
ncbi:hypothetical protein D3C84_572270 [compost metagenome]